MKKRRSLDVKMWKCQALSGFGGLGDFVARHGGKLFVCALFVILLVGIVTWNRYYRTLGEDEMKIQTLLSEKKDIVFDESLHTMLLEQWKEREDARKETLSVQSIPFVASEK